MELDIIKLKQKLNSISSDVDITVGKNFSNTFNKYYNIITFNNLVYIFLLDDTSIEYDMPKMIFNTNHFSTKDFVNVRKILDFLEFNEDAIRQAIVESIKEY